MGAMDHDRFTFSRHLLLFLLVCADSANSQVHYYITPSLSVHCPGDPCLTLPQFAADSTSYLNGNETNISLTFLPGSHKFDRELSISHAESFSMTKDIGDGGSVLVECDHHLGRFSISETSLAVIKDLHFIGCGGNKVSRVVQLRVKNTIFEGLEGRGTALVLNEVTDASLTKTSFLSNTPGSIPFEHHDVTDFTNHQDVLNYLYHEDSSFAVGGALHINLSNVFIANSKFTENIADKGGALLAYNSSLHIVGSTYSYNKADFGGVMITSESSVTIKLSIFSENTAEIYGGVMITYRDSFSISGTSFISNTAGDSYGVLMTFESLLNITYATFSENTAEGYCGVMYAVNCPFSITSSNFTSNNALFVGVMATYDSSFNIISCTFTNNTAAFMGGVMVISDSLFEIANSIFTNNSAAVANGGVMAVSDSSFIIANSTFINNRVSTDNGGVMAITNSSFNIISSAFYNNSAAAVGGVVYASESSFNIANSIFTNNAAYTGGVIVTDTESSCNINSTAFINNIATNDGGVKVAYDSSFHIINSVFTYNLAGGGGVMIIFDSSFSIASSTFANNSVATNGGVMYTSNSSFNIGRSFFANNTAPDTGGVIATDYDSSFNIISSTFINNSARADCGGVMAIIESSFNIIHSVFLNNSAATAGGVVYTFSSSFNIISSTFTNNIAYGGSIFKHIQNNGGGVIGTFDSLSNITNSTFTNNSASGGGIMFASDSSVSIDSSTCINNSVTAVGGVINSFSSRFNITRSIFSSNKAAIVGGVIVMNNGSSFNTISSMFTNNSAAIQGGVAWTIDSLFNIIGSSFYANKANSSGGIMITIHCSILITNSIFGHNSGSLYVVNTDLTFSGYTIFENCAEPSNKLADAELQEGGAITSSIQSTVIFSGVSSLSNNQARYAGAILAIESKIFIYNETIIDNNTATASGGGGISLHQSDLEIRGNCIISGNYAERGGGIHATSSTIAVYQPWILQLIDNTAKNGSGVYLEGGAKMYVFKSIASFEYLLIFRDNIAIYGGAIYVADDTNSGACSSHNECFIQTLAINLGFDSNNTINILFSGNTASEKGANLFGGLLDRCIPSQFAELYIKQRIYDSGVNYLGNISNITAIDTISSLPVRICFCKSENESEPDCSYQPPTFKVMKGGALTVSLVAVDQVNHSVAANIISSLSSQDSGFSEGQQTQSAGRYCSNVIFNVFSPHNSETINLYADGPCGSSGLSIRHLYIEFTDCTCPIGFQPLASNTRCECDCDSKLSRYITDCNSTTESLVRVNTNSWITHINNTDPPGYVIHPNCPFDYCRPPTENVSMNFNLLNGSDAQCAYDRSGVLCGTCRESLSLSLGSSRCLSCHSYWPAVFAIILIAAIIAGILLVTALLALNMTVAVGPINGFIFYANIVAANSAVFFPSSEPSFPTVFVAWLNLDIGIDVCFFNNLDAYINTLLQLVFPLYIISLVIIIIIVSEYSLRFTRLIGKRDPITTLATLIQLSYAKLLSVTIKALSFAILHYPDGSRVTVWLPDGNVPYFQGKHVALALVALLIILVGVPYTILLFLWQWLVRSPKWKVFKWTRSTKLNAFISAHHAPYNNKYRYWTGLLLLVRVILYITASVTVSGDPEISLIIILILVGSLSLIKEITGARVYKDSFLNTVGAMLFFNLLALSCFSWYRFKTDFIKQTAVAYTSTIITFILLVGVIIYHVYLLVRKDRPLREEEHDYLQLAPVQPAKAEVTYSIVEIPNPNGQSPQPEYCDSDINEIEVRELRCTETHVYQ